MKLPWWLTCNVEDAPAEWVAESGGDGKTVKVETLRIAWWAFPVLAVIEMANSDLPLHLFPIAMCYVVGEWVSFIRERPIFKRTLLVYNYD